MILALWAAAVPAGAGSHCCMTAVDAVDEQLAGLGCSASADGFDGAQMTGQ